MFHTPLFLSFILLTSFCFILDKPTLPIADKSSLAIADDERDTLKCANDIVANPIITTIIDESSNASETFRNALHLQIVQGCQHLRAYLASINHLMDLFNNSLATNSASTSVVTTSSSISGDN